MKHLKRYDFTDLEQLNQKNLDEVNNIFKSFIDEKLISVVEECPVCRARLCSCKFPYSNELRISIGLDYDGVGRIYLSPRYFKGNIGHDEFTIIQLEMKLNKDLSMKSFANREEFNNGMNQLNEFVNTISSIKNYLEILEKKGYSWEMNFTDASSLLSGNFGIKFFKIKKLFL